MRLPLLGLATLPHGVARFGHSVQFILIDPRFAFATQARQIMVGFGPGCDTKAVCKY